MQSGEWVAINGRYYRLDAMLPTGAGSYGQVWAAAGAAGRPVAIKFINIEAMTQADPALHGHWRAHLEREIGFLTGLDADQSRHVVALLDHGELDGQPVLVLERLQANLGQWLAQRRRENAPPPDLSQILGWTEQILDGLDVVHQAGFIYRDLKFSNLLIGEEGARLKLADFGSLKREDGDNTRSFIGTPATMAPEQILPARQGIEGHEYAVDYRADYYALGLLLFIMLTERPTTAAQRRLGQLLALHGQEGAGQQGAILGGLDPDERELLRQSIEFWTVPVLPEQGGGAAALLADLIERLLARDPADRPSGSVAIRSVLDAARISQPPLPAPLPDWEALAVTEEPPNRPLRRAARLAPSVPWRPQRWMALAGLGLAGAVAWAMIHPVADIKMNPEPSPGVGMTAPVAATDQTPQPVAQPAPVTASNLTVSTPAPATEADRATSAAAPTVNAPTSPSVAEQPSTAETARPPLDAEPVTTEASQPTVAIEPPIAARPEPAGAPDPVPLAPVKPNSPAELSPSAKPSAVAVKTRPPGKSSVERPSSTVAKSPASAKPVKTVSTPAVAVKRPAAIPQPAVLSARPALIEPPASASRASGAAVIPPRLAKPTQKPVPPAVLEPPRRQVVTPTVSTPSPQSTPSRPATRPSNVGDSARLATAAKPAAKAADRIARTEPPKQTTARENPKPDRPPIKLEARPETALALPPIKLESRVSVNPPPITLVSRSGTLARSKSDPAERKESSAPSSTRSTDPVTRIRDGAGRAASAIGEAVNRTSVAVSAEVRQSLRTAGRVVDQWTGRCNRAEGCGRNTIEVARRDRWSDRQGTVVTQRQAPARDAEEDDGFAKPPPR